MTQFEALLRSQSFLSTKSSSNIAVACRSSDNKGMCDMYDSEEEQEEEEEHTL